MLENLVPEDSPAGMYYTTMSREHIVFNMYYRQCIIELGSFITISIIQNFVSLDGESIQLL